MDSGTKTLARWFGLAVLLVLALAALFAGPLSAQAGVPASIPAANPMSKVDKQVLLDTANGQKASFVILLTTQADLSAAYNMKDQDARGWYVYNTLRDVAATAQAPIRNILNAAGVPFTAYWAANMIIATGDLNLVQSLAARSDVRSIDSNDPAKWITDPEVSAPEATSLADAPSTVELGVQNVNAPAVWALGYTGQGIVVASQDTGVRWTHNALKPQYRGWNGTTANHNYNWWDAIHTGGGICGANSQQPCDDYFHGSHTTGTAVGSDGGVNQIGVAPGAKWIGCRNMDQGTGTPARYSECFQFMIAPTDLNGQNPNPVLRPHVIINSWGCPTSEGCTTRAELETIVNQTQAAGIFVEVSAGNSGPGCSSVTDPAAIYSASFSVGAINAANNTLASFSSRGPSLYYTPNLLKPEISAPGVSVRSVTNTGDADYTTASGTSMAGPHVAGVVALIWSARPALVRDITGTKQLLEQTANPNVVVSPAQTCGGIPNTQIPNNSFGYGRIDALAAYNASGGGTPTPTVPVPTSTATHTAAPATATNTAAPATATNTPIPATATRTNTAVPPTATRTNTAVPPTATRTNTPAPTNTPGGPTSTATDTPAAPTATSTIEVGPTNTPGAATATPTTCTVTFTDVPLGSTFYVYIHWMACNGVVSGYPDGTFRPNNPATRGQISKIVVLAFQLPIDTTGGPHFADVAEGSTFYTYVETLSNHGSIGGYACGGPGEPCGPGNLPYFRPNNYATRGQVSKIVVLGGNIPINVTGGPHFADVPPGSAFYDYVETLYNLGVLGGYPCGGTGEPCQPLNLPYFRPGNNVTRGQLSKIVYLTRPTALR